MKQKGSFLHAQVPVTCPYPEPTRTNPYPISHFLKIHLHIILPSMPRSLSLRFSHRNPVYTPLFSPMHATHPAHLILLDFITRTILGEEDRSLSSSLCSFLHSPPLTLSLLCPNILNTLSLHFCFNVNDQVSHPYITTGKSIFLYILICIFFNSKLKYKKKKKRFCSK